MKYFRRFRSTGEPFFIDEKGNVVAEAQARTNLVENSIAKSFRESAADTAAAKAMVGNFVQDRNQYGPSGIYKVASVDDDGSATLHGPIGKGGMKTVSHSDLVNNHMDLGSEQALGQVKESAREKMEEAFSRFAPEAANL